MRGEMCCELNCTRLFSDIQQAKAFAYSPNTATPGANFKTPTVGLLSTAKPSVTEHQSSGLTACPEGLELQLRFHFPGHAVLLKQRAQPPTGPTQAAGTLAPPPPSNNQTYLLCFYPFIEITWLFPSWIWCQTKTAGSLASSSSWPTKQINF